MTKPSHEKNLLTSKQAPRSSPTQPSGFLAMWCRATSPRRGFHLIIYSTHQSLRLPPNLSYTNILKYLSLHVSIRKNFPFARCQHFQSQSCGEIRVRYFLLKCRLLLTLTFYRDTKWLRHCFGLILLVQKCVVGKVKAIRLRLTQTSGLDGSLYW